MRTFLLPRKTLVPDKYDTRLTTEWDCFIGPNRTSRFSIFKIIISSRKQSNTTVPVIGIQRLFIECTAANVIAMPEKTIFIIRCLFFPQLIMTFPLKNAFKQKFSMLDLAQGKIWGTKTEESSLNKIPSAFKLCTHGQNRLHSTEIFKIKKQTNNSYYLERA